MTSPKKRYAILEAGKFYHVYNRGNGGANIFYNKENYFFFLRQFERYCSGLLDVYTYCLMPNHFHLLIGVKELPAGTNSNEDVKEALRHFFISYSQAINRKEGRNGSLFQKRYKRILVDRDSYFTQLIQYIHHNPIHHGFVKEYADWHFSSYNTIISNEPTTLMRSQVLKWFGGLQEFIDFHEMNKRLILPPDKIY